MCQKRIRISSVSLAGIKSCYVPCGVCVDCRRKQAQAWSFRINAEFLNLKKRGWNVAFCTLTYRDSDLPTIPEECFKSEYKRIPCFNRAQVRKWIDDVRQYCKYHFDFKRANRMHYFIATELGTLRHRPHMHAVLAWPNSVSYEKMHEICTAFWKYGFLFPRDPRGDGKCLSFEVVGDASKCLTYVSKYVCKDLELLKLQSDSEFYSERKKYEEDSYEMRANDAWRNCQSFHIQSQSLGFEAIKNLSDEDKLDIYRHGLCFSADKKAKPQQVPIYIKNKLLFDPYYMYDENGKRTVTKRANEFFLAHAHEIFDIKSDFYTKYCSASRSPQYFADRGLSKEESEFVAFRIHHLYSMSRHYFSDLDQGNKLGEYYLAYHRVSPDYCYNIELCNQWMLRYYPDARLIPCTDEFFLYKLSWLRNYFDAVDYANSLLGSFGAPQRENDEENIAEVRDFFNNLI